MDTLGGPEHHWSDSPRQKSDIRGRTEFANVIAKRIDSTLPGQDSTVFGIVGDWGGGKTTLLKEITGELGEWEVVWFNPWSAADADSIAIEFVSSLASLFPTKDQKGRVLKYARYGRPALKLVPFAGDALSDIAEAQIDKFSRRPPWHEEFQKLSEMIDELGVRVLVIVDDVDRLDETEMRSLLRIIRLLGRFSNVHYLLAYDDLTIEQSLGEFGSRGFMEKIVQYPYEVPPAPRVVRRGWARAAIASITDLPNQAPFRPIQSREELIDILALGLETPRSAERLREQIVSLRDLARNAEIDFLDFVGLTWLRISHHKLWDDVRRNSEMYITQATGTNMLSNETLQRIANLTTNGKQEGATQKLIEFLFSPHGPGAHEDRKWRVRNTRYFERYFHIGLADDDVSEVAVRDHLEQLASTGLPALSADELKPILLGEDFERSSLAFQIVRELRAPATESSLRLLKYANSIRTSIVDENDRLTLLRSNADLWVDRELRLLLKNRTASVDELHAILGLQTILSSSYSARRETRGDQRELKHQFSELAPIWLRKVAAEPLEQVLSKPELIMMTGFCIWISEIDDHRGYLETRINTSSELLDTAAAFVNFDRWSGIDSTSFEAAFRREEFEFALGATNIKALAQNLPTPKEAAEYETDDLPAQELTPDNRRDFALRQLKNHY